MNALHKVITFPAVCVFNDAAKIGIHPVFRATRIKLVMIALFIETEPFAPESRGRDLNARNEFEAIRVALWTLPLHGSRQQRNFEPGQLRI